MKNAEALALLGKILRLPNVNVERGIEYQHGERFYNYTVLAVVPEQHVLVHYRHRPGFEPSLMITGYFDRQDVELSGAIELISDWQSRRQSESVRQAREWITRELQTEPA